MAMTTPRGRRVPPRQLLADDGLRHRHGPLPPWNEWRLTRMAVNAAAETLGFALANEGKERVWAKLFRLVVTPLKAINRARPWP